MGATDAAGYDEHTDRLGGIGGWWSEDHHTDIDTVYWFSLQVPRSEAWAYKDGSSKRRIAALELMGTVVLMKLMQREGHLARLHLTTPVATDNKGNAYGLSNDRFKKWPQADILLELTITCHLSQIQIGACHVKRKANTWADRLADGATEGFNPALRRHFDLKDEAAWTVWHKLKDRHGESSST